MGAYLSRLFRRKQSATGRKGKISRRETLPRSNEPGGNVTVSRSATIPGHTSHQVDKTKSSDTTKTTEQSNATTPEAQVTSTQQELELVEDHYTVSNAAVESSEPKLEAGVTAEPELKHAQKAESEQDSETVVEKTAEGKMKSSEQQESIVAEQWMTAAASPTTPMKEAEDIGAISDTKTEEPQEEGTVPTPDVTENEPEKEHVEQHVEVSGTPLLPEGEPPTENLSVGEQPEELTKEPIDDALSAEYSAMTAASPICQEINQIAKENSEEPASESPDTAQKVMEDNTEEEKNGVAFPNPQETFDASPVTTDMKTEESTVLETEALKPQESLDTDISTGQSILTSASPTTQGVKEAEFTSQISETTFDESAGEVVTSGVTEGNMDPEHVEGQPDVLEAALTPVETLRAEKSSEESIIAEPNEVAPESSEIGEINSDAKNVEGLVEQQLITDSSEHPTTTQKESKTDIDEQNENETQLHSALIVEPQSEHKANLGEIIEEYNLPHEADTTPSQTVEDDLHLVESATLSATPNVEECADSLGDTSSDVVDQVVSLEENLGLEATPTVDTPKINAELIDMEEPNTAEGQNIHEASTTDEPLTEDKDIEEIGGGKPDEHTMNDSAPEMLEKADYVDSEEQTLVKTEQPTEEGDYLVKSMEYYDQNVAEQNESTPATEENVDEGEQNSRIVAEPMKLGFEGLADVPEMTPTDDTGFPQPDVPLSLDYSPTMDVPEESTLPATQGPIGFGELNGTDQEKSINGDHPADTMVLPPGVEMTKESNVPYPLLSVQQDNGQADISDKPSVLEATIMPPEHENGLQDAHDP